nr:hypothetical protein GCM10025730_03740 [Promicromonospora thailandica]
MHGVEGPAGGALERVPGDDPRAPELAEAALTIARALSTTPGVTDMSQHVLALGTVRDSAVPEDTDGTVTP